MTNPPIGYYTAAAAFILIAAFAVPAPGEEPAVFAITNAKIVPVSGPLIEKGTVVIRNGIIESVGAGAHIPGDARVIDATGLTCYPGLIDALSDAGLDESRPAQSAPVRSAGGGVPGATPAQAQQPAPTPDELQGLTPYRQAADLINASNRKIESMRSAGITTALVVPRGGIFAGQSCLANLSGTDVGHMVIKAPVAFHLNMASAGGFRREYPGSLMGIIAFVKQTLLDAQRYDVAWSTYAANPGAERPEYNRALGALQPAVKQNAAVVLPGSDPVEIRRALDLADAFRLNLILSGGAEAGAIASELRDRKIPVLLNMKFPERERDADPEAKPELTTLRRRVEAPQAAALLAKAGVKFAFQSADMAQPRDFIRNVGKAVEAGLDKDAALRSLTITAAEIFGVADRLGTIEPKKTANLILTTGDLFSPSTRVKIVFIDGRRFEITEAEPARSPEAGAPVATAAPASGSWSIEVATDQGPIAFTLNLQQQGEVVTGSLTSHVGNGDIADGKIAGNQLSFRVSVQGVEASFSGTIQGDAIRGTMTAGQMGTFECKGARTPRTEFSESTGEEIHE